MYDKTTGIYFDTLPSTSKFLEDNGYNSIDIQKQYKDKLLLCTGQKKDASKHYSKVFMEPIKTCIEAYESTASTDATVQMAMKSNTSLYQDSHQICFYQNRTDPGDETAIKSAKCLGLAVNNSTDEITSDLNTLEFGKTHKHRLQINEEGKLYIQKLQDGTWIGADVVIGQDENFYNAQSEENKVELQDDVLKLDSTSLYFQHPLEKDDGTGNGLIPITDDDIKFALQFKINDDDPVNISKEQYKARADIKLIDLTDTIKHGFSREVKQTISIWAVDIDDPNKKRISEKRIFSVEIIHDQGANNLVSEEIKKATGNSYDPY
jgi:hypothetical protein